MSSQRISTPLTELLGVDSPVMLAGMGGIAGKELVAAVANAGGFGTWGSATAVANMDPEELRAELRDIRERCNGRPFGVDLLVSGAEGGVMKQLVDMFADEGVKAFISGKGFPRKDVIDRFHARGVLVGSIAGRVKHAVAAVAGGVDFVIAQGHEAGGHTGNIASSVLLPQIVDAVNGRVPVVAAGGIFDGRGLASALAMGAAGVWVGTRFMLTPEAETHTAYKQRFLDASAEETVLTRAYTGAPLRVIKNPYVQRFLDHPEELEEPHKIGMRATQDKCWVLHSSTDSAGLDLSTVPMERQAFVGGQCIGAIEALKPAAEIVAEMVDTAASIFQGPKGVRFSKL